ncbi:hypothetical protein VZO05_12785 [Aggregatilineales bacterium SYSU G02658]
MTNYLIFGHDGQRALLLAQHLPRASDQVWLVARERPRLEPRDGVQFQWIRADLSERGAGALIAHSFGSQPLDVCIYDDYPAAHAKSDPERSPEQITALRLTTTILCIQKLMSNLRQSPKARIVFIGQPTPTLSEPTHTQLGIRSVAQALREVARPHPISVTCLYTNGDFLAEDSLTSDARRDDLLALMRCVINLSPHSAVQELDLTRL